MLHDANPELAFREIYKSSDAWSRRSAWPNIDIKCFLPVKYSVENEYRR